MAIASFLVVLGIEVGLWLAVARERLDGAAWSALVVAYAESVDDEYLASCMAVDPALYSRTSAGDLARVKDQLSPRGVSLKIAPPTLNPPFGYLDRECVEVFLPPAEFEGWNLPVIAKANIAYYTYDFNGDGVLMLQLGTRWLYLTHWNEWM